MQLFLHASWQPKETHEDPHWRENTQVCSVWVFFHSLPDAGKSHADPYRRCVINVLIPVLSLKIWNYTSANTQERNLSTVTNVTTPVLGPNVWKYTSVTTQERNPSNVTSAVTLANNQVTCSGTRGRCTRQQTTCKNKQFWLYWTGHYFVFVHADRK